MGQRLITALNYSHFKIKRENLYREKKRKKRFTDHFWLEEKEKGAHKKIHLEKSIRGQSNFEGK